MTSISKQRIWIFIILLGIAGIAGISATVALRKDPVAKSDSNGAAMDESIDTRLAESIADHLKIATVRESLLSWIDKNIKQEKIELLPYDPTDPIPGLAIRQKLAFNWTQLSMKGPPSDEIRLMQTAKMEWMAVYIGNARRGVVVTLNGQWPEPENPIIYQEGRIAVYRW
ncbi:hypothetical protein [Ereboglobus sp. PH5-5]|uniref:hypothetical protein n=1 Tax=Ereboglobus sp. PH5-5 TaxID=2940529 RepID=UPI00240708CA|nr:hypothetical protein [Ereboglobus sp. PH5-5]